MSKLPSIIDQRISEYPTFETHEININDNKDNISRLIEIIVKLREDITGVSDEFASKKEKDTEHVEDKKVNSHDTYNDKGNLMNNVKIINGKVFTIFYYSKAEIALAKINNLSIELLTKVKNELSCINTILFTYNFYS